MVCGPAECAEIVGQVFCGRGFVGGLDRSAEIGNGGIDPEEYGPACATGALGSGDRHLVGALAGGIGKACETRQPVGVDIRARSDVCVMERGDVCRVEAVDDLHHDISHVAAGQTLTGDDDTGFPRWSLALIALAAEIDVVGFHRWRFAAIGRRDAKPVTLAALGHGAAQALMQIPRGG